MQRYASLLMSFVLATMLTACATPATQMGDMEIRSGVIQKIVPIEIQSDDHQGVGAVLGGLGGLAIGSLMGQGTGRDVMMVVGAIAGGYAGHEVQQKYDQPKAGQQVLVRLNNGVLVSVTQPVNEFLRSFMRVYIEGTGTDARVVPQDQ